MDEIRVDKHNDDAERSLLGAAFWDIAVLDKAIDRLTAGDFYRERHRHVWRAMCALHEDGVSELDPITVADKLADHGYLDDVGGASFLVKLTNEVPSTANADQWIAIVEKDAKWRRTTKTLQTRIQDAYSGKGDPDDFIDDTLSELYEVTDTGEETMSGPTELAELGFSEIEAIHEGREGQCLSTGFIDLDQILDGGYYDSDLIILAGRPGMGKTSLAMDQQRGQAVAEDDDESTANLLFASLEMSRKKVAMRHFSGMSGVPLRKIKNRKCSDEDWRKLMRAADPFKQSGLHTDDEAGITPQRLRAKARRVKAEHGLDAIYIDYLQLMRASGDHGRREQEVSEISRSLKEIAKDLEIPVIALCQLNRSCESREDKRPKLRDLRESGAIEQDADVVCFLYRGAYYDEENADENIAEVLVEKNRNGETGRVKLYWQPETMTFDDLSESWYG